MRYEILDLSKKRMPLHSKNAPRTSHPTDTAKQLMVITMGPEDFPEVDDKPNWSSPQNQKNLQYREIDDDASYWGDVRSVDELRERIDRGWEEGADQCLAMAERVRDLVSNPVGPRRRLRWKDQGDEIRMDRVYSGELDRAWRSMPRVRGVANRVISIDVDAGHNCMIRSKDLFWAGASAVALTDALEGAGYRVELYSTTVSSFHSGNAALTRMQVKAAGEPLNVSLVAALLALPATFRWYHINSWAKCPWSVGGGWGNASYIDTPLQVAQEHALIEGSEITIPMTLSEDAAVKQMEEVLEKLAQQQDEAQGVMA